MIQNPEPLTLGVRFWLPTADANYLKQLSETTNTPIIDLLTPYIKEYLQQNQYLLDRYEIIYGDIYVYPLSVKTSRNLADV